MRPDRTRFCLAALLAAQSLAAPLLRAQRPPPPDSLEHAPQAVLLDRDISPLAGTMTLLALGDALHRLEDRILPVRLWPEYGSPRRLGRLYRLARLMLIDGPIEALHVAARHELVGHGGRARQLGLHVIRYEVDLPPPYGDGGGLMEYDFSPGTVSALERASLAAAGTEVATIAAVALEERWIERGRLDYRDALHYLYGTLSNVAYIADAMGSTDAAGHDVIGYLVMINESAPAGELTAGELYDRAAAELLNPQLWASLYAVSWNYLIDGDAETAALALTLAGVRIMPRSHLWLSPMGPEIDVGLMAHTGERLFTVNVRRGTAPRAATWGVRLKGTNLVRRGAASLDLRVDAWLQPELGGDGDPADTRPGGLVSARGRGPLPWTIFDGVPDAVIELGIKSAGFSPGEALNGGVVLRLGVGW